MDMDDKIRAFIAKEAVKFAKEGNDIAKRMNGMNIISVMAVICQTLASLGNTGNKAALLEMCRLAIADDQKGSAHKAAEIIKGIN